jgi:UDP-glucose:(heptosyl)LPS alpha-1,3-glucosyltransferase
MVAGHFERFLGIPANSLRVIHSAIDPARFAAADRPAVRAAERATWGVPDGVPVGLFVAMNYRLKGLAPLIRAVARVPRGQDFRLAVVGHPDDFPYRRLADRLGVADRVLFLGFRRDPRAAYFAADFLAHPTFYDPCSLVALEALACGLPVLTSRFNGAAELLGEPAAGAVVRDPHDAAGLAAAIGDLLNPAHRRRLAELATKAAAAWTFDDHYRALVAVFAEVRDRKRGAA